MSAILNQTSNYTEYNRTRDIFEIVSKNTPAALRILSFGCSTGEEVRTLADLYFPYATIDGYDICGDIINSNRRSNTDVRINYVSSLDDISGTYDLIFCMSVLCRWPTNQQDYSFNLFQRTLMDIDRYLSVGGHLVLYNTQYILEDTILASTYENVSPAPLDTGFVIKYDKTFSRLLTPYTHFMFRKKAALILPYSVLTVTTLNGANIGDDIQTLAAIHFLKKNGIDTYSIINREALHQYSGPPCYVLMNGWFIHNVSNFPPPPHIIPIFLSFHCAKEALIEQNVKYFRSYAPIGCRDMATVNLFHKYGIDAYFTGCLTLTFDPCTEKGDDVLIVDIDTCPYIPKVNYDVSEWPTASYLFHDIPRETCPSDPIKRLELAEQFLEKYRRAKLVITSRLHCALPCRAFRTPVKFIHADLHRDPRFVGLTHILGDKIDTIPEDHITNIVDNLVLPRQYINTEYALTR